MTEEVGATYRAVCAFCLASIPPEECCCTYCGTSRATSTMERQVLLKLATQGLGCLSEQERMIADYLHPPLLNPRLLRKTIVRWGGGGGVLLPKKYIGRQVLVVILEEEPTDEEEEELRKAVEYEMAMARDEEARYDEDD